MRKLIATFECGGLNQNDYGFWKEDLIKKGDDFFIEGSGGPLSKYVERYGGMFNNGEETKKITEAEAQEWIEKCVNAVKNRKPGGDSDNFATFKKRHYFSEGITKK